MTELNQDNLPKLSGTVGTPTYDRSQLTAGIVHVGVGGFHRAHQAFYLNRLLEANAVENSAWAIHGVGLREADRNMGDVLGRQDGLYTVIVKHPDGNTEARVIGSIVDYTLAANEPGRVINLMAAPSTKIVSLTITEGGYNFHPATGAFNFDHPDIQWELKRPGQARTIFGFLTAALRERRKVGERPFTVLSCDNILHNGDVARKMLLAFTGRQDPELAEWIERKVSFPNSMVDRITPVTQPEDIALLADTYGLTDRWPVTCEPFLQWVVEDKFCNGRPPLEVVGVQFVPDVTPYEKMKLRLLNAGHSVLGIPGALHGHPTIDACTADQVFAGFLRAFLDEEATPALDAVPGIDLDAYKSSLLERFANPAIRDGVSRICAESSAKLPVFLLPTLRENLARGGSIRLATLTLAAWCRYHDTRMNEAGQPLEIIDALSESLHRAAARTKADTLSFIRQQAIFGDLAGNDRFEKAYSKATDQLYADQGIRELLVAYTNEA